jgi:sigma-54 specific flagellar transcriptional regulator A
LFGHRKGAFTGAVGDRLGRYELAHGGTLFLDEIGDLPMDMQVKLLRVLQERCVLPVGASREVPIDVRVVAATHKKLQDEVAAGRFREDLYYRINVLPITTTALRDRPEDIAALLQFYADRHVLPGARALRFAPEMLEMLQAYHWPGNVRELSNLVDRFSTLYPSQILHVRSVPACMLPDGLAALQAKRLAQTDASTPLGHVRLAQVPKPSLRVLEPEGLDQHSTTTQNMHKWDSVQAVPPVEDETAAHWLPVDDPLMHLLSGGGPTLVSKPPVVLASNQADVFGDEMNAVEEVILLAQGIQTLPPNGMSLKYPDLKKSINEDTGYDEWTYRSGDQRKKIYGGLLCENLVQALARIIVGWQMLQISRKYRVVMTTHDEVVAMPKTREAQKCFEFMTTVMSTAPAWCSTIPLNCEGGHASNYSK